MKLPVILVAVAATAINSTLATAGELQANSTNVNGADRSQSILNPRLIAQTANESSRQKKKKNYVSLTSNFGKTVKSPIPGIKDQSISEGAITGKIGISESISIRPFIAAGTGNVSGVNFENATFGASVTYDLNIPNSDLTPYGGIGYATSTLKVPLTSLERSTSSGYIELGADYQLPDSNIILNANYKLQDGGTFGISAGWGF
jgi:hypothetical protein